MTSIWARGALVGGLLGIPSVLLCQGRREAGLQGIVTAADPVAVVGGVYGGVWVERRLRLVGTAGVGGQGGELAWRVEGLAHFHFNPRSTGIGVYGGGGLALAGGVRTQGYVVVLVGLEATPGGTQGWAVEVGVGGGVRIGIGYRWRQPLR